MNMTTQHIWDPVDEPIVSPHPKSGQVSLFQTATTREPTGWTLRFEPRHLRVLKELVKELEWIRQERTPGQPERSET